MKQLTLLILIKENQILLAMKKRGFGVGKWNGIGGKQAENETIEETCVRECWEEINVKPKNLSSVGILNFYLNNQKTIDQKVFVYVAKTWEGEPSESEEMAPRWFKIDEIPYQNMWQDDIHWLPLVLNGKYVEGDFWFDDKDQLLKYSLNKINN